MSELSPRARQMLQSSVSHATVADRERIQNALRAKLGAAAFSGAGAAVVARATLWPLVSGTIVGVGLVGGALFLIARQHPQSALPPARSAAPPAVLAAGAPLAPPADPAAPSAPVADLAAALPAPASARPADRLAQELAFMERATSALHAGRAASALKILAEYQHQFPKGMLGLERSAARAQALCSLGRRTEAQAELSRLPAQSPAVARAQQVCDASSKEP